MSDYPAILNAVIWGIILIFLLRYILKCLAVKRKSELFAELKNLNNKYISSFYTIQKKIKISYECNSLQQYRNNCNKPAIINYMCGRIRENEAIW